MIRSLEIVHKDLENKRKCIKYFTHKPECCEFLNQLLKEIDKLEVIKKDLEILELIIKWKNNIYFKYDFEYLDDPESHEFVIEFELINDYLSKHFGYIPKCFNKVGDSNV